MPLSAQRATLANSRTGGLPPAPRAGLSRGLILRTLGHSRGLFSCPFTGERAKKKAGPCLNPAMPNVDWQSIWRRRRILRRHAVSGGKFSVASGCHPVIFIIRYYFSTDKALGSGMTIPFPGKPRPGLVLAVDAALEIGERGIDGSIGGESESPCHCCMTAVRMPRSAVQKPSRVRHA